MQETPQPQKLLKTKRPLALKCMDPTPSLRQQQGYYRYNPAGLDQGGPARIFPYNGQDGVLRHVLTQLRHNLLDQGQLSQPWSQLLQPLESAIHTLDQSWGQVATLLVDLEIFQSGWFNFNLPPNEQFSSDFVRLRREMGQILLAAREAAQTAVAESSSHSPTEQAQLQRRQFYQVLVEQGRSHPTIAQIHERDGGLSDAEFARQRLAGPNPLSLRRFQQADQSLLQQWGSFHALKHGKGLDLTQAASQNRLFLADYPLLGQLTPADLQAGRYVGNPQTLFYRGEEGLEPALIQLERGGKVFSPATADSDDWMRAKLYTQVADATQHELITHLCYTHLAMEAIAIATARQLPIGHPLAQLLRPHFHFLLAINSRGNGVLLAEDGAIDRLLAPTREASLRLINQAYRERPFQNYALPLDIQQRGVESEFLPDYPYRDDAYLLWEAIARYTQAYLQRYYPDDQAVQRDLALQAWAAELGAPLNSRPIANEFPQAPAWLPPDLVAQAGLAIAELPDHPRVPGFPSTDHPGQITQLQELVDLATLIIFTCGPQHAAVNFSQFDYFGYVPNAPLAAYARPDSSVPLEELLPPPAQDLGQIELTFALSGIRWSQLGSPELIRFVEPGDRHILQQFQADLEQIEGQIQARNRQRLDRWEIDYPYLLPSRIPNSINI